MAVGAAQSVGLLGGSFDPVHRVHIELAEAALESLALDCVELLPASRPWQRADLGATAEQRLEMLQIACDGRAGLRVNAVEIQRAGTTYTVDTLRALPGGPRYTWIMGTDQLANFCTWHRWREIIGLVRLAVALRPGAPLTPPEPLASALSPGALVHIPFEAQPVSATLVRSELASGRTADDMLDPRVLDYIRRHHLYTHRDPSPGIPSHS